MLILERQNVDADWYQIKNGVMTIGRLDKSDIVLQSVYISRLHAIVHYNAASECVTMKDMSSMNGLCVNGKKIKRREPHILHIGDAIEFNCLNTEEKALISNQERFLYVLKEVDKSYTSKKPQPKKFHRGYNESTLASLAEVKRKRTHSTTSNESNQKKPQIKRKKYSASQKTIVEKEKKVEPNDEELVGNRTHNLVYQEAMFNQLYDEIKMKDSEITVHTGKKEKLRKEIEMRVAKESKLKQELENVKEMFETRIKSLEAGIEKEKYLVIEKEAVINYSQKHVEELQEEIKTKDEMLQRQTESAQESHNRVKSLEAHIEKQKELVIEKKALIEHSQKHVEELQEEIKNKDEMLQRQTELAQIHVKSLESNVKEQKGLVKEKEDVIERREKYVEELQNVIKVKDEMFERQAELAEKSKLRFNILEVDIEKEKKHVKQKEDLIERNQKYVEDLEKEIINKDEMLQHQTESAQAQEIKLMDEVHVLKYKFADGLIHVKSLEYEFGTLLKEKEVLVQCNRKYVEEIRHKDEMLQCHIQVAEQWVETLKAAVEEEEQSLEIQNNLIESCTKCIQELREEIKTKDEMLDGQTELATKSQIRFRSLEEDIKKEKELVVEKETLLKHREKYIEDFEAERKYNDVMLERQIELAEKIQGRVKSYEALIDKEKELVKEKGAVIERNQKHVEELQEEIKNKDEILQSQKELAKKDHLRIKDLETEFEEVIEDKVDSIERSQKRIDELESCIKNKDELFDRQTELFKQKVATRVKSLEDEIEREKKEKEQIKIHQTSFTSVRRKLLEEIRIKNEHIQRQATKIGLQQAQIQQQANEIIYKNGVFQFQENAIKNKDEHLRRQTNLANMNGWKMVDNMKKLYQKSEDRIKMLEGEIVRKIKANETEQRCTQVRIKGLEADIDVAKKFLKDKVNLVEKHEKCIHDLKAELVAKREMLRFQTDLANLNQNRVKSLGADIEKEKELVKVKEAFVEGCNKYVEELQEQLRNKDGMFKHITISQKDQTQLQKLEDEVTKTKDSVKDKEVLVTRLQVYIRDLEKIYQPRLKALQDRANKADQLLLEKEAAIKSGENFVQELTKEIKNKDKILRQKQQQLDNIKKEKKNLPSSAWKVACVRVVKPTNDTVTRQMRMDSSTQTEYDEAVELKKEIACLGEQSQKAEEKANQLQVTIFGLQQKMEETDKTHRKDVVEVKSIELFNIQRLKKEILKVAHTHMGCSICTELYITATTLNCSHTYCRFCIDDWCCRSVKPQCPQCRRNIKEKTQTQLFDSHIDSLLEHFPEEQQIRNKIASQRASRGVFRRKR